MYNCVSTEKKTHLLLEPTCNRTYNDTYVLQQPSKCPLCCRSPAHIDSTPLVTCHVHFEPKLTAIIQSCRLTLFGHIMRMDDNADAKRILLVSPPADWRRQLGRPCITWLSTVQQDLKQHHLTLPEAADLAQNRPLRRMMSTYGATQS